MNWSEVFSGAKCSPSKRDAYCRLLGSSIKRPDAGLGLPVLGAMRSDSCNLPHGADVRLIGLSNLSGIQSTASIHEESFLSEKASASALIALERRTSRCQPTRSA